MTTAIAIFEQPTTVPAYLKESPVAKTLATQMEGGLAGRSINRISLRNGKFRFNIKGVEVGVQQGDNLDVVIIAANPAVSRIYYAGAYDAQAEGTRPDCYSRNGETPEADSPNRQADKCALCPQNAVNSSRSGQGKACAYKKRVIVVDPTNIMGTAFAMDIAAMGLFGEDDKANRKFNLKSYIEALKANGFIIPAVVTRMTFDDEESVPKLLFTPMRALTAEEWAHVEQRAVDPVIKEMLDEVQNEDAQVPKQQGTTAALPQATAPAPQQTAPQPTAQPVPAAPAQHTPAPPRARRGRPPAADTPPVAAPQPTAAPPAAATGCPSLPCYSGFAFHGSGHGCTAACGTARCSHRGSRSWRGVHDRSRQLRSVMHHDHQRRGLR
jgi:hypothetical protein